MNTMRHHSLIFLIHYCYFVQVHKNKHFHCHYEFFLNGRTCCKSMMRVGHTCRCYVRCRHCRVTTLKVHVIVVVLGWRWVFRRTRSAAGHRDGGMGWPSCWSSEGGGGVNSCKDICHGVRRRPAMSGCSTIVGWWWRRRWSLQLLLWVRRITRV